MKHSVIIPVYKEQNIISAAVSHVEELLAGRDGEIIVVDATPGGATLAALPRTKAIKLTCAPGRGTQMNEGARKASGDVLLFLHADTRLPPDAFEAIESTFSTVRDLVGAFRLRIDSRRPWLKFVAWTANVRNRFTGVPYGDQAIFIGKEYFNRLGGYRELPIMEDIDLMERVRGAGGRVIILPSYVVTSPRRWEKEGMLRTTAMHNLLRTLHLAGCAPKAIERFKRQPSTAAFFSTLLRKDIL